MIYLILALLGIALLRYSYAPELDPKQLKSRWCLNTSRFIDINGLTLHYTDQGDKAAPVLLMLHGLSSSVYTWRKLNKHLSDKYRIICIDLPGFGLTGPWPDSSDYSAKHYQQLVKQFIVALNITQYSLIGNSFGGEIAWRLAKQQPEKVTKLILINATCRPAPKMKQLLGWQFALLPIPSIIYNNFLPKIIIKHSLKTCLASADALNDEMIMHYYQMARRSGNRNAMIKLLSQYKFDPQVFSGATLTVPTLILWGEQDRLIPLTSSSEFSQYCSNSQTQIIANTGHIPHEEAPATVANYINRFLAQR